MGWFTEELKRRMRNKYNNIIIVIGEPRIGKTYFAASNCEELDPSFKVNTHLSIGENLRFLKIINSVPDGSSILFDEPQLEWNARKFMSDPNQLINDVVETFGFRRLTVFLCLPISGLIDIVGRSLTMFQCLMKKRGFARIYKCQYAHFSNKLYTPFMGTVETELPSEEFIRDYELYKRERKERRYSEGIEQLQARKEVRNQADRTSMIQEDRRIAQELVMKYGRKLTNGQIANYASVGGHRAMRIKAMIKEMAAGEQVYS